jgi:hypothetical protein
VGTGKAGRVSSGGGSTVGTIATSSSPGGRPKLAPIARSRNIIASQVSTSSARPTQPDQPSKVIRSPGSAAIAT